MMRTFKTGLKIFKEIMAENFSKVIKDRTCQMQESLGDPRRKTQNNFTSRYIIVKLWNTKDKEK